MITASLFVLSVALAFVSALTLLAKNEGIRGAGRVIGGFAWTFFGVFLLEAPGLESLPLYTPLSALVIAAGLLTLGSGVRKYLRRNADQ